LYVKLCIKLYKTLCKTVYKTFYKTVYKTLYKNVYKTLYKTVYKILYKTFNEFINIFLVLTFFYLHLLKNNLKQYNLDEDDEGIGWA